MSRRLRLRLERAVAALKTSACVPGWGLASDTLPSGDERRRQVLAAETRLLHDNATTGIVSAILIALPLAYAMVDASARIASAWLAYMLAVTAIRAAITRRYRRAVPTDADTGRWSRAFVAGAALAAAGWAAAGMLFYQSESRNGTFVVFVIGGVMLGAASLLAARREAFLTFLLPTGLITSLRLAAEGDEQHLIMGFLGALFTAATVATTWRFHQTIESSLTLRFENQELIDGLRTAKDHTDALNRELELRVRDRTARLTEADQRKDEFLATLAHELRNPLAPIRNALGVLKLKGPPTPEVSWARDVIDRQMQQMTRLIEDLLDTSRIGTGKIELQRQRIELAEVVHGAVEASRPLIAQHGHELCVELPREPVYLHGDLVRLSQVFCNLLNNAARYTQQGGRIEVTGTLKASAVLVSVRDNGIGIPRDMLPKVFEMFTQVDRSLERSRGGLGIGLTLVKQLVELHGGRVEAHSAGPGHGSEFVVRLPVLAEAGTRAPATPKNATQPLSNDGRRVLVVDDNQDAAESLAMLLRLMGLECVTAHDGLEGVKLARELRPDIVLLDIGLPGMNGYDAAAAIRAEPWGKTATLVALTGWGQSEDRRRSRVAGFDVHLVKPVATEQLVEVLERSRNRETETAAAG